MRLSVKLYRSLSRPRYVNMTSTAIATIAQEIKLDIFAKTHVDDNLAKRKEISRTFIC